MKDRENSSYDRFVQLAKEFGCDEDKDRFKRSPC